MSMQSEPDPATQGAYWYYLIQPFNHHLAKSYPRGHTVPYLHVKCCLIEHVALQWCSHLRFIDELMGVQIVNLSAGRFLNHISLFPLGCRLSLSCVKLYNIALIARIHRTYSISWRCVLPLSSTVSCPGSIVLQMETIIQLGVDTKSVQVHSFVMFLKIWNSCVYVKYGGMIKSY